MRDATFATERLAVGPFSLQLEPSERLTLQCATPDEAAIVALLAAGIVKASSGTVLIDDYDPRVQPVHCKRVTAHVPHEPFALDQGEFARYVAYRAALWNVDLAGAFALAELLRERLRGMHEAFAYPLIGALIGLPRLLILDRPQAVYAPQIHAAVGAIALLSTHSDPAAATAFA
jgi:hypothetical protein